MSLWDELILPAGTLDQLRRDASAERPTHAWLLPGRGGTASASCPYFCGGAAV